MMAPNSLRNALAPGYEVTRLPGYFFVYLNFKTKNAFKAAEFTVGSTFLPVGENSVVMW